jgi:hypothetical protein
MIDYCQNHKCQNAGVCQPKVSGYTCQCLQGSYSGEYCQITSNKIFMLNIVSKSFAYVAIIAILFVIIFIVIMDILKYCFGIDPTEQDLQYIRREKRKKIRKVPVIQRFIYVNAPPPDYRQSNNNETII